MAIALTPYAGAPDVSDPALTGEWATGMGAMTDVAQIAPWCSYLAERDGIAVGVGGFKGPPDDAGVVEIAYLSFVAMRGRGVATGIADALIGIARANGVSRVRAHTLPETNASTQVLTTNGFAKLGEVIDPDDGQVWRWERAV